MRLIARLRRFARARKGLAALEFAILAPMMIFLLFGSVEMIDVLSANSRAQNTAASLADVVARDTEVSNAELNGLWDAIDVLMYPNNPGDLNARITSIRIIDSTTARVAWSEGHGMSPRTADSPITLPAAMMAPGTSVILAETEYAYRSPVGIVLNGPLNMRHDAYRRSRLVDPIPRIS